MNKPKRIILLLAMALIVIMGLFPPYYFKGRDGFIVSLGYCFIGNAPMVSSKYFGLVNYVQLLVQWLGVMIMVAIGCLITNRRS
jgi:hypothetical protein